VKTSVNLVYKKKTGISIPQALLAAAVFVVVLTVFAKFAVINRLTASGNALREAERLEEKLAAVERSNEDYEEVLREYQHYYFSAADGTDEAAQNYVNCQDVLGLLDAEFLNKAGIQMVNLSGNVLTVNLTRINLEAASEIAKSLMENKMVKEVLVSAANKQERTEGTMVFLTIVLETKKDREAKEEAGAEESAGAEEDAGAEESAGAEEDAGPEESAGAEEDAGAEEAT